MKQFFETFGIDLSTMADPFENFDKERFVISPFGVHPDGDYRVLLSSFYSYAEVSNAKVTFAGWALHAKVQIDGAERRLTPGSRAAYGMYRYVITVLEIYDVFKQCNILVLYSW